MKFGLAERFVLIRVALPAWEREFAFHLVSCCFILMTISLNVLEFTLLLIIGHPRYLSREMLFEMLRIPCMRIFLEFGTFVVS